MVKRVLLVDPDVETLQRLKTAWQPIAGVEVCSHFPIARRQLLETWPDVLVTNLRLGAYNGLHLVYLAVTEGLNTHSLVYADHSDSALIREAQASGAFYESAQRVSHALPSYLQASLPSCDRRHPAVFDRRQVLRGGRRAADLAVGA